MRKHTILFTCICALLAPLLCDCGKIPYSGPSGQPGPYAGQPKPIPEGRSLLGKTYYPKGVIVYNDGTLYLPAEATIIHGMVYPDEGCDWVNSYYIYDLRVACREVTHKSESTEKTNIITQPQQQPQQQQQQQQQQQTVVFSGNGASEAIVRGMVMLSSTPENVEVFVDGAFVGNSPANLKLPEGIHIIEAKKAGFKPYRKELRIYGASELNLRVTLEKE